MKRHHTYLIFTIIVFIVLLVPSLVQDGMFFDGVTYSAISKNLANGYGSFIKPHYTKTLYPEFYEHPPLVFLIQSYFFKIFGNAFYTESIYCFLIALLTAILIAKIWILMVDRPEIRSYLWLPVLMWLTVPIISWSYRNNMLENTMGLFTVIAVYYSLKAFKEDRFIYILFSSIFIIMAFLSKGPVGLFPVVTPLIYAIVVNNSKKSFIIFFYLLMAISLFSFVMIVVFPDLKFNINMYLNQQLFPALSNKREITTDNRFQILFDLFRELLISIFLVAVYLFYRYRRNKVKFKYKNLNFGLFILIAISASIPLIISLKQRTFYLVPSFPFYALGFSFLLVDFIKARLDALSGKTIIWLNSLSYTLLVLAFIFSILNFGKLSRDEEKLKDVYLITKYFPEGTILSSSRTLWSDWSLVAYLSRVGYISLDCNKNRDYYLVEIGNERDVPGNYKPIDLKLNKYRVMKYQVN